MLSNDLLREVAALKRHPHKSVRTGLPSGNYYTLSVPIELLGRIDALLGRIDAALVDQSGDATGKVEP